MVNKYTLTLALVVGVLVLIGIVVDSLKTSTLALMALVVLLLLPLVGVALLQAYQLTHGARPQAKPRNDEQAIETSWRELPRGYYPPQAALMAPACCRAQGAATRKARAKAMASN